MFLPHMSTAGAAWMGLLGTSLWTRMCHDLMYLVSVTNCHC